MADSDIACARDVVVNLLNAAVQANGMPLDFVAEKKIVPPAERAEIQDLGLLVWVFPATATVKRLTRGKVQQVSTIAVGVIEAVTLAGGSPDQDRVDRLMGLAERIADYLSLTCIGDAEVSPYEPELIKEGVFLARVAADFQVMRDLP